MKQLIIICSITICFSLPQKSQAFQDINNPKTKWRFKTQGAIRGTAVILNNNIYFGSSDNYIYALNKDTGALIWKHKTNGALVSSPSISNNSLYISSRDNHLYSININDGSLNWKYKMNKILPDIQPGWDYFMPKPIVVNNQVLIGSGDGHLYSINTKNGNTTWTFKTKGRIRATPLVHNNTIYQPSNDGNVYVLNLSGKLIWKFATFGALYNQEDFNFDRASISAQPKINDNTLVIAARDGNTYAIDLDTHDIKWKFTYGNTWAMSAEISDDTVFIGWSTNDLFSAVDFKTGKEKWKFKSGAHNYTNALISKSSIYIGSADGKIYRLNKLTGEKQWEYSIGKEVYSTLIYNDNAIYFGSDDGYLYAIENGKKPFKAVFHPINKEGKLMNPSADKTISHSLKERGYEHINSEKRLHEFIVNRLKDKAPSVIVFPYLVFPNNVIGDIPEKGLIRQYLNVGGKIVFIGDIPNYYSRDESGKQIRNTTLPSKVLDVTYPNPKNQGNYFSKTTQEGLNWGLPKWLTTTNAGVKLDSNIIPLAFDEFKNASIWIKKFNHKIGSGFLSIRTWSWSIKIDEESLNLIDKLARYGLE